MDTARGGPPPPDGTHSPLIAYPPPYPPPHSGRRPPDPADRAQPDLPHTVTHLRTRRGIASPRKELAGLVADDFPLLTRSTVHSRRRTVPLIMYAASQTARDCRIGSGCAAKNVQRAGIDPIADPRIQEREGHCR